MFRRLASVLPAALIACASDDPPTPLVANGDVTTAARYALAEQAPSSDTGSTTRRSALVARAALQPNELGRIPVLEYHLIGDQNSTYMRTRDGLRRDLEVLYERGFRPVSMSDMLDRKIDLPPGLSPVVIVFDDASPSQFRYVESGDGLAIDPESAVGILLEFRRKHRDWANKSVFCMLPAAEAGRAFFGNKGIEGQKTEWRFAKVRFLFEQGFELCNHTLWHANLRKYPDAFVQEQIARGQLAIDSAVPGYKVRTFALPLGMWPTNRELAVRGAWSDAKSGREVRYDHEAVLEVTGGPARSPYDPAFNPRSVPRVQVIGDSAVVRMLDWLDKSGQRYVSDGRSDVVARKN